MTGMIPYGRQDVTDADIQAVVDVLRSDYLTQGPAVPAFEKAVASYCGVEHAIAANSATSALHIACLALGVGKGDIVWTSPITFVASANCALYCGASVDFVDIDFHSYNMSIERLQEKLEQAEKSGRLPKVVIPVHLAGQSCEMKAIHLLSKRYGFKVIEDASHAIGGKYQDMPVGDCRFSDITIFSFHPVKIITTGEGGMAVTNNPQLARKMELLRSHGVTRDPAEMSHAPDGPWYYQQIDLGFNYRMTDIQAALGLSQMSRLDDYVAGRHEIAEKYNDYLADISGIELPRQHPDTYSAWHLYIVRLTSNSSTHLEIFNSLRRNGVGVNLHYIPVHLQPYYQSLGFKDGNYPEAESYYKEALSLPLYPLLTNQQIEKVVEELKRAIG